MKRIDAAQFNSLMKGIASKDERALEAFCKEYEKLIYTSALAVTKSSPLANEVLNDVLIKIWQIADQLSEVEKPLGWLYRVSTNCAKDRLRREPRAYFVYEERKDSGIDQIFADDQFYYYLSVLKEDERKIMIFRYIEDFEFQDIAQELDMPLSSVTSRFYRATKKIKKKFFRD